jgi:hypothetical protein
MTEDSESDSERPFGAEADAARPKSP